MLIIFEELVSFHSVYCTSRKSSVEDSNWSPAGLVTVQNFLLVVPNLPRTVHNGLVQFQVGSCICFNNNYCICLPSAKLCMISAKAVKYAYGSSNSPGQLVPSKKLLFRSALCCW